MDENQILPKMTKERQYLSGLSIEDLELILHPMAEEGKEASGSEMTHLSCSFKSLQTCFITLGKTLVKLLTPIDLLRENKVMSLKTRFGNLGNILDFDNLTEENIYVLDSPVLTNSQLSKFKKFF